MENLMYEIDQMEDDLKFFQNLIQKKGREQDLLEADLENKKT